MLLGSVVATILVIVVTVQIALDTSYWTIVNHLMVWGSLVWYFIMDYFYNFVIGGSYVGSLTMVSASPLFFNYNITHSFWCKIDHKPRVTGNVRGDVLVHGDPVVHNAGDPGAVVALLLHRRAADPVGPRPAEAAARPDALAPEPGRPADALD